MNEKSKPIGEYISLEDAIPEIYKHRVETGDTRDDIRKEIIKTGEYDKGAMQFQNKDGALLIRKVALKDWINKRKKEKNGLKNMICNKPCRLHLKKRLRYQDKSTRPTQSNIA